MGLGKTYSTQYLLDSNNNSGVAGQVLSTTSTGIDWVDANTVPGSGLWLESGNNIYNSNSGNVGIGTTSPTAALQIQTDTTSALILNNSSNSSIQIKTDNTYLSIDSGGYIQTSKTILAIEGLWTYNTKAIRSSESDGSWVDIMVLGSDNILKIGTIGGVSAAGDVAIYTDSSEKMRIIANGNVGIGTTSPTYKLQIGNAGALADSIRIGSYDAVKNTRQYIGYTRQDTGLFETSTGGNTPSSVLPGVSGIRIVNTEGSLLSTKADQSIQLLTHIYNGSSRVALHANYDGKVGIGTTTPERKLHVFCGRIKRSCV